MTPTLDQAVTAVTAAEATYNADVNNVATIEANVSTASAPLPAAQAQVATDQTAYVSALNDLVAAAQAKIATLDPPPPPPVGGAPVS